MEASGVIDADGQTAFMGHAGDVPWWSVTKTVLATAALRLVENGVARLDETMPGEVYTLRQLLRHEAGLPDYGGLAEYHRAVAAGEPPWPAALLVERVFAMQPPWPPGGPWVYSNLGYRRLGAWIAGVSRRPLAVAVRDLVLTPAGAGRARFAERKADLAGVAMGAAPDYDPGWVHHGLIVGPLDEAARLLHRLLNGRLLGAAMLDEMKQTRALPQFDNPRWQAAYGLGLMAPVTSQVQLYGHTGGGPGSSVAVYGRQVADGWAVAADWRAEEGDAVERAVTERLLAAGR